MYPKITIRDFTIILDAMNINWIIFNDEVIIKTKQFNHEFLKRQKNSKELTEKYKKNECEKK